MKNYTLIILILFILSACGIAKNRDDKIQNNQSNIFNNIQRKTADEIISIFENDTTTIQYDYVENLSDGRGITAGRVGFTSATGDMLEVIKRYTAIVPNNSLAVYIPRLEELSLNEDGSTTGLEGLEKEWKLNANKQIFRDIQDEIVDEWYFEPATEYAKKLGAKLPLTLLNLYDAIIQQGGGDDPDGLQAMIDKTTMNVGGTMKDGIDEKIWLLEFMRVRKETLEHPNNKVTQEGWSESVGRGDTLLELYNNDKFYLELPIEIDTWGTIHVLDI